MKTEFVAKLYDLNVKTSYFEVAGRKVVYAYVGESGRGRREGRIIIHHLKRNDENHIIIPPCLRLYKKPDKETWRSHAIYDENCNFEYYLYATKERMGFRGSMYYEFDENMIKSDDVIVIATGVHAQGAAGRMGSGYEYFVAIKKELVESDELTLIATGHKSGRYYNNPGPRYIVVGGGEISEITQEQLDLLDI